MRTTVLDPVGVEVRDLPLPAIGPDEAAELQDLLAAHGVAVLRDQHVDDAAFVAFLRRFGELVFTTGETPVPGFPGGVAVGYWLERRGRELTRG